jgi:hypothetical protein
LITSSLCRAASISASVSVRWIESQTILNSRLHSGRPAQWPRCGVSCGRPGKLTLHDQSGRPGGIPDCVMIRPIEKPVSDHLVGVRAFLAADHGRAQSERFGGWNRCGHLAGDITRRTVREQSSNCRVQQDVQHARGHRCKPLI